MRKRTWSVLIVLLAVGIPSAAAQTVSLSEGDGEVWTREQVVTGRLNGTTSGTLLVNGMPVDFEANGSFFGVSVQLNAGLNTIVACTRDQAVCTDTLRWTLPFTLRPDVFAYATVEGEAVRLQSEILENPDSSALSFTWSQDPENPQAVMLSAPDAPETTFSLPDTAPPGEYYFNLTVTDADGDPFTARTFVTVDKTGIIPFDIETDHAAWIDRAVLYEIAPRFFKGSFNGKFRYITESIPELVALGINTIWLQPIFETFNGQQAYDVTGYFETWDALGPTEDLRELIETAHAAGLKVILDFVPNHSSIHHPYAQDAIAHGAASPYYDLYMRERDDAPYSQHYNVLHEGEMTFVYYFWEDLMTFNYQNPETQRFIIEASRYWIEHFDIDGYRLDAVWGPHARNPDFTKAWRLALKRVKPEILLLAEAKAPYSEAFAGTDHPSLFESFDVAYDWTDDAGYISQWAFQVGFERDQTIFNSINERLRSDRLRSALTNGGEGFPPGATILRFIENNDTPRFINSHSVAQTRMAATLMFALPGIPILYYGQEVGTRSMFPSYPAGQPIRSFDRDDLFPFYQHLNRLRTTFPALYGPDMEEVAVAPDEAARHTYAFRRWTDEQHILGIINMADEAVSAAVALPIDEMNLDMGQTYYLTDLFSGETMTATGADLMTLSLAIEGYTTRLLAIAEHPVEIPTALEPAVPVPSSVVLGQNYPNPFPSATVIPFELPNAAQVRVRVFDVLGRVVTTLLDASLPAGKHEIPFRGGTLPSGMYFYRLDVNGHPGPVQAMVLQQ